MKKESEVKEAWKAPETIPEPAAQEEFTEFGIRSEDGRRYIVTRSFLLPVKFGPPVAIPKGATVFLSKLTADQLFVANKVEPEKLGKFFKAVRNFSIVKAGEWIILEVGDTLEIEDRQEALELLKRGDIREIPESEVEK